MVNTAIILLYFSFFAMVGFIVNALHYTYFLKVRVMLKKLLMLTVLCCTSLSMQSFSEKKSNKKNKKGDTPQVVSPSEAAKRSAFSNLQRDHAQTLSFLQKSKDRVTELESANLGLRREIARHTQENEEALQGRVQAGIAQQLEALLISQRAEITTTHTADIARLQASLTAALQEKDSLTKTVKRLTEELETAKKHAAKQQDTVLENSLKLQVLQTQVRKLEKQIQEKDETIVRIEGERDDWQRSHARLQTDLAEKQTASARISNEFQELQVKSPSLSDRGDTAATGKTSYNSSSSSSSQQQTAQAPARSRGFFESFGAAITWFGRGIDNVTEDSDDEND